MKAAREFYEALHGLLPEERLDELQRAKGHELAALLHYAEGREASDTRDQVIGLVLVVAGHRYLEKKAAKRAKWMEKAKRIF